ncbi:hypothetical protein FACS1894201_09340 [Bacteroidia bacterium]|nr:hypothetical protein FACS1894201_09340 [Bacteroidia bacterium]
MKKILNNDQLATIQGGKFFGKECATKVYISGGPGGVGDLCTDCSYYTFWLSWPLEGNFNC